MTQPANGRNDHLGTGALATYTFNFPVPVKSQVRVVVAAPLTGVETPLVYGVDYTVDLTASGGTITLLAGNLAVDWKISILLRPPYVQDSNIKNNASYYRASQEEDHDRRVRQIIALADEIARSLKLPECEAGSPSTTLIPALAQRINKYAYWDGTGKLTAVAPPAGGGGGGGGGESLSSNYQGASLAVPETTPTNLEIVPLPGQPSVLVGVGVELEIQVQVPGAYDVELFADPGRLRSIASYVFDNTAVNSFDNSPFGFVSADASAKVYATVLNRAGGGASNVTLNIKQAAIALSGSVTANAIAAALAVDPGLEFVAEGGVSALRAKTVTNGGVRRAAAGLEADATVLRTSGAGQSKADLLTLGGGLKISKSGIVGPPTSGAHTASEIVCDVNGNHWLCTADGTPGVWAFWGSRKQTFAGVTASVAAGATGTFELATYARAGLILRLRIWPSITLAAFDIPYKTRLFSKETRLGRDLIKEIQGYGRRVRNSAGEPLAETSIAVSSPGSLMPGDAVFIDDVAGAVSEHNRLADVTATPTLVLETGLLAAILTGADITTVEEETGLGWWNDTVTSAEKFKLFASVKNEHASQATTFRYEVELLNLGSFA